MTYYNTDDLISDINKCDNLKAKFQENRYAQNFYAALCNNEFLRIIDWDILLDNSWSCSWRAAGRHVAEIRDCGEDYISWYCSGFVTDHEYVAEGVVTEEIKNDLKSIGWIVKDH